MAILKRSLLPLVLPVLVCASNKFGVKFLADNQKKDGVVVHKSGLQYKVLQQGTGGGHPKVDTTCECHYEGRTAEKYPAGSKFDSSYDRGETITFAPNQVIKGWTIAMQMMVEGDKWELYIPSDLGYGDRGSPPAIKGGDVLVFTMEIIKIKGKTVPAKKKKEKKAAQKESDGAAAAPAQKESGGAAAAQLAQPTRFTFSVAGLVGEHPEASFTVEVHPEWAPLGAARFRELVGDSFFEGLRFFRVIDGFMAQFGIHGDPGIMRTWSHKTISDDPSAGISNTRGRISFAMAGKNTRSTQFFINFGDNKFLDKMGFTPLAEIVEGLDVVDHIFKVGEGAPQGPGPSQGEIQAKGNAYLDEKFPKLSYVTSCTAVATEELAAPKGEVAAPKAASPPAAPAAAKFLSEEAFGNGLKLSVTQAGDGHTFPQRGDQLTMHYTLTLAGDESGKVIDSSRARNEPFTFSIGGGEVVAGWDKGVMKMSLGQRGILFVPSALAYGAQGTAGIPPNADLKFDVEVLDINGMTAPNAAGLEPSYDPLGVGVIAVVFVVSLSVLFFVACRGTGKRIPRPGSRETKDIV